MEASHRTAPHRNHFAASPCVLHPPASPAVDVSITRQNPLGTLWGCAVGFFLSCALPLQEAAHGAGSASAIALPWFAFISSVACVCRLIAFVCVTTMFGPLVTLAAILFPPRPSLPPTRPPSGSPPGLTPPFPPAPHRGISQGIHRGTRRGPPRATPGDTQRARRVKHGRPPSQGSDHERPPNQRAERGSPPSQGGGTRKSPQTEGGNTKVYPAHSAPRLGEVENSERTIICFLTCISCGIASAPPQGRRMY